MATATTTKDPVLQEHTRLVRTVESNLKLKLEDRGEIAFRAALLARAAEVLPNMNQTLATRLYESVMSSFPIRKSSSSAASCNARSPRTWRSSRCPKCRPDNPRPWHRRGWPPHSS